MNLSHFGVSGSGIFHEYVSNSSATDADDIISFVSGTTGEGDGLASGGSIGVIRTTAITSNAGRKKRVALRFPINSGDRAEIEILVNGVWLPKSEAFCWTGTNGKFSLTPPPYITVDRCVGIILMVVDSYTIDVLFGRQPLTDYVTDIEWNSSGFTTGTKWRLHVTHYN